MKSILWLGLALVAVRLNAQFSPPITTDEPKSGERLLVDIGPNHRSWAIADTDSGPVGGQATVGIANGSRTKPPVVEIATGMNYWDGQEWLLSDPSFGLTEGAFVATRLHHKVRLPANLNAVGAVTVTTRDGITLRSTPVGIGLYDAASGKAAIIAAITNCTGVLVSSNQVVYENAFAGVCADVVYTIQRHSFEQDVIITSRLDPEDYGFPAKTTRIQIFTEFYGAPEPERITRPLRVEQNETTRRLLVSPDLVDEVLGFGEFVLATGRASTLEKISDPNASAAPVAKAYQNIAGRTMMIESVEYPLLKDELKALPECALQTASVNTFRDANNGKSRDLSIPSPRTTVQARAMPKESPASTRVAAVGSNKRAGVAIDYIADVGSTVSSGFIFRGDTTYLVAGAVVCSGSVTIEGGAVFKFKHLSPATASIKLNGTLTCKTSSYRPAVFTAVDDDSVGESMNGHPNSGYTLNPHTIYTDGYANPALWINNLGAQTWSHLRFSYCQEAIRVEGTTGHTLWHSQLVNCIRGIKITGSGSGSGSTAITVNNSLFAKVQYPLNVDTSSASASLYHCTTDPGPSSRLVTSSTSCSVSFVNSVFINVTTPFYSGTVTLAGNKNGFYSTSGTPPTFGTAPSSQSGTSQLQSSGAGNYYLTSTSPWRNYGTTSINSTLANDLKLRTTSPPDVLDTYWLVAPMSETWVPTVLRDTDNPDIGYHYAALDRLMFGTIVSNTSLSLGAGLAIGVYGYAGFFLTNGATLCSQGTPLSPVQLCYFNQVQEQPILLGPQGNGQSYMIGSHGNSSVLLRSTRSDVLASGFPNGYMYHFYSLSGTWVFREFSARDSSFAGGFAWMWGTPDRPFALNNNLFHRVTMDWGGTPQIAAFNNLFYGCTMAFWYDSAIPSSWEIRDNAFDQCAFDPLGSFSAPVHSHNAYIGMGTVRLQPPQSDDKVLTSLSYATGPLGGFYQLTTSPMIETGSGGTSAANRGLSAYTVLTANNTSDAGQVDVGLHYHTLNSSSQPIDANPADGTPDYSVNSPPLVNAGADFTATNKRFRIEASVFDDARGCSGYLALNWSKVSGPGSVTFETQNAEDTYVNVGQSGTYTFSLSANDSQYSVADQITVIVSAPNAAPAVITTSINLTYREGSGTYPVDSAVSITDSDDLRLNRVTASIIENYASSEDSLTLNIPAGSFLAGKFAISGSGSSSITVTAIGGSAAIPDFEAALRLVQYKNTSVNPSTALRRVQFTAVDEQGASGNASRYISIQSINQPPIVNAGPEVYQATAGVATSLQGSVTDVDSSVLTKKWTVVSAPTGATVTFSPNDQTPTASATFPANGTYVLRLQGSDEQTTAWDETTVSVCGGFSPDFDLALVVDTSDTMFGSGLEEAKRAAKQFVEVLLSSPGDHRIAVIPFSDDVCSRQTLTSDLDLLYTAIDELAIHGGTFLDEGIYAGALELWSARGRPAAANPRKVIVIISDGISEPTSATAQANQAKNSGIRIISVGTPGIQGIDATLLTSLASSPSAYLSTQNATEIAGRLLQIAGDPCSLILTGPALNGSAYDDDLAQLPPTVCDNFVVKEDSVGNNLDILANDNLPPTTTLADLDIFVPGNSGQEQLSSRVAGPFGTFEAATIEGRPVIQFTPKPDYFTYLGEPSISGSYQRHNQPATSVSFKIRVTAVDDAPIANPDYIILQIQGGPPQDVVVANQFGTMLLLLNDTHVDDPDEDPLHVVQVSPPAAPDAVVLSQDGKTLTYHVGQPLSAFPYTQTLTYTVSDARNNRSSSTVTFKITSSSTPEPPEARPDEITVSAGIIAVLDVLRNDISPTGIPDELTLQPVGTLPALVRVSPTDPRMFEVDTRAQPAQDLAFSYRAIGPTGLQSATVGVVVHITGKGESYSAQPDSFVFYLPGINPPTTTVTLDPNPLLNDVPEGFPLNQLTSVKIVSPPGPLVDVLTTDGGTLTKVDSANGSYFTFNASTTSSGVQSKGSYTYNYRVTYPDGIQSTATITIYIHRTDGSSPNNNSPVARITSPAPLQPPPPDASGHAPPALITQTRVTSGILRVCGEASDPDAVDAVTYVVTLYRLSSQIDEFNDQPRIPVLSKSGVGPKLPPADCANATASEILTELDLSGLPNGVYEVELVTIGGGEESYPDTTRLLLESELKLGRVQHSEVDYVVNVPGLRLTIQRSYDSLDANAWKNGDLGYGWRSVLNDLQVEVAEERVGTVSLPPDSVPFSIRTGGSRDITLTLPDGRRRTFIQTFTPTIYQGFPAFKAIWSSPADAPNVKLEALNERDAMVRLLPVGGPWVANSQIDFDTYDIGAFKLTTPDGTIYEIQRDNLHFQEFLPEDIEGGGQTTTPGNFTVEAFGRARVVKVTQPTGDVIEIDGFSIKHKGEDQVETRALKIDPDELGRIRAIYVPNSDGTIPTHPVVEYEYDDIGNLVRVRKLVQSATPNPVKVTTTYQYTDPNNPHLLTGIIDGRGVPLLVNEYDDAGRLVISREPDGKFTRFDRTQRTAANAALFKHANSVGREVVTRNSPEQTINNQKVIWPLSVEVHEYDANGNLVYSQDAAGLETTRQFGTYNQVTQEQWSVPNQGSGGATVPYTRSLEYGYSQNPLLPTAITDAYANGTPTANQRRTALQYDSNGRGLLTRVYEPNFSTSQQTYRDYSYDANNPTWVITETFTGTDPAVTSKALVQNNYYSVSGPKYGKVQWTKDGEGNSTVHDYYTTQAGGRPGDLLSVTVYGNDVADPANPGSARYLSKSTYTYDASGNHVTETRWRYLRDANGNFTTGEEAFTTTFFYDALGRTIKVSDPQPGTSAANKDTVVGQDTVYNSLDQVASVTDRYNQTTRYYYDRNGELSCTRYPDGTLAFTVTHYDSGQRCVVTEDPHNYPLGQGEIITGTRVVYDAAGRPVRTEKLAYVAITESTQGAVSNPSTSPDTICDTAYNPDLPATVLSSSSTEYYADGRVWKTIDARGRVSTFEYSGDGLRRITRPPDYLDTTGTYSTQIVEDFDLNDNLLSSQVKSFLNGSSTAELFRPVTKYLYDQLNRRKETRSYDDENASAYVTMALSDYDYANRRIRETDADGTKTRFYHDGQGRLTSVVLAETLPGSTTTSYQYDELGNLIGQIDANNRATRFQYDALGRRTRRTLPEPGGTLYELWTYDYLESGEQPPAPYKVRNKVYHEDFTHVASQAVITLFDSRGRLDLKKQSNNQVLLDIGYRSDGKRSSVKDTFTASISASAQIVYDYDASGRLWHKHQPLDATSTATLTYQYYDDGAVKRIQSDFSSVSYAYDGRGRLWKVNPDGADPGAATSATPADATYEYDPIGNLKSVTYRNGVQTTYAYNTRNQLRRARATNTGGMIANFDYDEAGQVAIPNTTTFTWGARRLSNSGLRNRMADYINGTSRTVDYDYDKLQRVTQETIGGGSIRYDGLTPVGGSGANMLGYDAVGNRQSRRSTVSPTIVVPTPNNVPYDVNDRTDNDAVPATRSTRFDANGNTTAADLNGDGVIDASESAYSYTYDLDNRLLTANGGGKSITLSYDGDGNRVKKVVTGTGAGTTYYVVDDMNPTGYPQVIEERGCAGCSPTVTYVYGLDLVSQNRSGQVRFFGYDGSGSVRYLTDGGPGGAVMDTYTYDAFGIQLASTGSTINWYRYTGEQWDQDLGLYYLRARYYSSTLGRFWTMDSFEGNQEDPLSLHKYLYAGNNPVNNVDPSGHEFTLVGTLKTGTIGAAIGMWSTIAANHALGRAQTYSSILTGGALGAVLGPLAAEYAWFGVAVGGVSVASSGTIVWDVFQNPNSTYFQKVEASALLVASVWGTAVGVKYARAARTPAVESASTTPTTKRLFRVITEKEIQQVRTTGEFETTPSSSTPTGLPGKWFYGTRAEAEAFAAAHASEKPTIVATEVTQGALKNVFPGIDGGKTGYFVHLEDLTAPIEWLPYP